MNYYELNKIAEEIIEQLKGKVVIHRYDATSTNSIYLKFDYGVANSLRISDHCGKYHLRYRFNILLDQTEPSYSIERNGCEMRFFPPNEIDALVAEILKSKEDKIAYYTNYDSVVACARKQINGKGFWRVARIVK